jgi:hypothetical protein
MPSTLSLIQRLRSDFPNLTFNEGNDFSWSHEKQTIYYIPDLDEYSQLLHEVGHAVLGHQTYRRDIELIALERDAWGYAANTLGPRYQLIIPQETIDEALDSYRDWLHARSSCPQCAANGIETRRRQYACPACGHRWRANEAMQCGLKRYSTQK